MRTGSTAAPDSTGPQFRQLTFDKGTIRDGRFTPDGQSIIYDAAWNGQPLKIFMARADSPESAPLSLPDARLLSISRTGELAISLGHTYEGWMGEGTLARSSMLGSAPRVMVEHVREADWNPDGSDLAIVRRMGGFERLEFRLGKCSIKPPDSSATFDSRHPAIASRSPIIRCMPTMRALWRWSTSRAAGRCWQKGGSRYGLAWTRDGSEIWFGGTKGSGSQATVSMASRRQDGCAPSWRDPAATNCSISPRMGVSSSAMNGKSGLSKH